MAYLVLGVNKEGFVNRPLLAHRVSLCELEKVIPSLTRVLNQGKLWILGDIWQ